jgi:hypothetical protein
MHESAYDVPLQELKFQISGFDANGALEGWNSAFGFLF